MPPPSALASYLFGLTALPMGVLTLFSPAHTLRTLGLPATALPAVRGNALAAIGMGIYYTLAAWQRNRLFFALSVPMRLLSTAVFWAQGWKAAAVWEGAGAVLTVGALWWEGLGDDGMGA